MVVTDTRIIKKNIGKILFLKCVVLKRGVYLMIYTSWQIFWENRQELKIK
jgi:hypothetical protein